MRKFTIDKRIRKELKKLVKVLKDKCKEDLSAVLFYGSWVKDRARENSDKEDLFICHHPA